MTDEWIQNSQKDGKQSDYYNEHQSYQVIFLSSHNDENSLACVLTIAYYAAKKDYFVIREFPAGKGFADIVLLPRPSCKMPAVVLELKFDKTAVTAISQIHEKRYAQSLQSFIGEVVLVGINYDRQTKQHDCMIERINMS